MALSVISVHIQRRIRYKMKKKLRTMLREFTGILNSILQRLSQARIQKFTVNVVNCKISHKTFHCIKIHLKLKKVYIQNLLQFYRFLYIQKRNSVVRWQNGPLPLITFARYFTQQKVLISKNSVLSLETTVQSVLREIGCRVLSIFRFWSFE